MFCRFIFVFLHRFLIVQTFREDEKNKGKKSYIVQQDNRIANEKDSFKRYERNVLYQAVRALQEKYPIKN